jgi:hypothetical protein
MRQQLSISSSFFVLPPPSVSLCLSFIPWKNKNLTALKFAAAIDKVDQLLAYGRWFSPGTPASSTTKTRRHDN